jgi:signal transduction histidine kinase
MRRMQTLTPDAPPPATALAAALARLRQRALRTWLLLLVICLGIALLIWVLDGGRFWAKLLYSVCIGLSCMLINDTSWLAQAALHDRLRALRGLPRSPGRFVQGWAGVVPSALLCLVLGPPLGQALADRFTGFNSPGLLDLGSSSARITLLFSLLATVVLMALISGMERLASARAQAEAAQRQAAEHQLRLLQSQLEPHMLFNTLANLRVLIALDASRAQDMLDHLIAYLRATLQASRAAEHPLATEFQRLADYLALMAVRMGPRLQVQLDLPEALRQVPVPPLLLQPLVENAIQHGLEPHVEGGRISVQAELQGAQLVLTVRDTGAGLPATRGDAAATAPARPRSSADAAADASTDTTRPAGTGFGLAQVRERLATLHGSRASLTLQPAGDTEGGTRATVRLPMPASSPPALP